MSIKKIITITDRDGKIIVFDNGKEAFINGQTIAVSFNDKDLKDSKKVDIIDRTTGKFVMNLPEVLNAWLREDNKYELEISDNSNEIITKDEALTLKMR